MSALKSPDRYLHIAAGHGEVATQTQQQQWPHCSGQPATCLERPISLQAEDGDLLPDLELLSQVITSLGSIYKGPVRSSPLKCLSNSNEQYVGIGGGII
uniref:Uncharacterized protein n=1 Tax=Anguilla anguilla TaxID=7936 RepID=A0A0E9WXC4_ANGAN